MSPLLEGISEQYPNWILCFAATHKIPQSGFESYPRVRSISLTPRKPKRKAPHQKALFFLAPTRGQVQNRELDQYQKRITV